MLKQEGITLIEMLVVVLIIGVLSSVLILVIDPAAVQGKARDGARLHSVKNVSEAIESYRQIEGSYPLDSDPSDPGSLLRTTYVTTWPQPIANDGSLDPANWSYVYVNAGAGFIFYSPNSQGGCFKYQTDWGKVMSCPLPECSTSISLESACN